MRKIRDTLRVLHFIRDRVGFLDALAHEKSDVIEIDSYIHHAYVVKCPVLGTQILKDMERFPKNHHAEGMLVTTLGRGLLTNYGESWAQRRKSLNPLFYKQSLQDFEGIIHQISGEFVAQHKNSQVQRINYSRDIASLTLKIIICLLFGNSTAQYSNTDSLSQCATRLNKMMGRPSIFTILGKHKAPRGFNQEMAFLHDHIISALRQSESQEASFIQKLKAVQPALSQQEILDETTTFLIAGYEAASSALQWVMVLLMKHPEVIDKIREEPGDEFCEAVVMETLRLYPPAWSVFREPLNDTAIGGVTLKAGSTIILPIWLYHRDPKYWLESYRFHPERFLDKSTNLSAFMPFGVGPRVCIGRSLAVMETKIILKILLKNINFRSINSEDSEPEAFVNLLLKKNLLLDVNGF